jgi:hypothetical protein
MEGRIVFPQTAGGPVQAYVNSYVISESFLFQASPFRNLTVASYSFVSTDFSLSYQIQPDGSFTFRETHGFADSGPTPSDAGKQIGAGPLNANIKFFAYPDASQDGGPLISPGQVTVTRFSATFSGVQVPEPTAALLYAGGILLIAATQRRGAVANSQKLSRL